MTPLVQLYWLRVALGFTAGAVTAIIAEFVFGSAVDYTPLINSITVALLFYFISYYILKVVYKTKIEKQSKILSTGIGIYFFSWLMTFVFVYTIIQVITGATV
jgi:hypothetical protein